MKAVDHRIIELNELRIGNLLVYKGDLVQVTSLSCDIDDEYQEQICFVKVGTSTNEKGGWNRSLVNDLKRIPLTMQWLVACGFIDPAGNGMAYRRNIKSADELCWYMQDGYLRYQTQGSGFTRTLQHIIYVHQLQNWWYSFTDEELPLKLTV